MAKPLLVSSGEIKEAGASDTSLVFGNLTLDASGLSSSRSVSFPDRSGVLALAPAFYNAGSFGSGICTLDYNNGNVQKVTATGNFTLALSNWPASGTYAQLLIEAVDFGTRCTFPTINWKKPDGTTTTTLSASGYSFLSSGTQYIQLWSTSGTSAIYGTVT
jgi:hypothetical protein